MICFYFTNIYIYIFSPASKTWVELSFIFTFIPIGGLSNSWVSSFFKRGVLNMLKIKIKQHYQIIGIFFNLILNMIINYLLFMIPPSNLIMNKPKNRCQSKKKPLLFIVPNNKNKIFKNVL